MIRSFLDNDIEAILDIWLSGNKEAHAFIPEDYWISHLSFMREHLPQAEVYVAESRGHIQGFAGMTGDDLAGIFVSGSCRSAGIGTLLLDQLKKVHAHISLKVYQENKRALTFYQKQGFSIIRESLDTDTGYLEYVMSWDKETSLLP